MIRSVVNMNDHGEIINKKVTKIKIWDESKGLLWRAKNNSTKMFEDIKLSEIITNKNEYANIHLLAEKIYKQTNAIMVRVSKTKVQFATIDDISDIIGVGIQNTRRFINKMIRLKIIAKRVDKIGKRIEEKYLINPLFFSSSKYLSADLYFSFRSSLDSYLTDWQKQLFHEYGNIKGEYVMKKITPK